MGKVWMPGGGGGADLDAVTVTDPWDVAAGKVIVDKEGNPLAGTLTERSGWTGAVGMNGSVAVPDGRHRNSKVNGPVITQRGAVDKVINCGQNYNNGAGYYDSIIVQAASLASQTGGATAEDGYVYSGKTYWRDGVKRTGNMSVNSLLSFSAAAYGGKQILLKWQNPYAAGGKPFSGVDIHYSTGGYPGMGGATIYAGIGSNSAPGGWSQVVVTMPALSTGYYFTIIPYVTTSLGYLYGSTINAYAATQSDLWLTFTSSQSYTIPTGYSKMDAFAVGGGGGSHSTYSSRGGTGGGGGYTKTVKNITVSGGQVANVIVGNGGTAGVDGSASSVRINGTLFCEALGGHGSPHGVSGYDGGGGSGGGIPTNAGGSNKYGGKGGSDGSNGYYAGITSDTSGGIIPDSTSDYTCRGQHATTRAWGNGTIYSGAGGGGTHSPNGGITGGSGGAGGGGNGTNALNGNGANGAANTGGGGGGGGRSLVEHGGSSGGSGIVLLHIY